MEEKASLMIQSSKIGEEISNIQSKLEDLDKSIKDIPRLCSDKKISIRETDKKEFNKRIEDKINRINSIVDNKKQQVSDLLDSYPALMHKEFAGKLEIKGLEQHLKDVYPDNMIDGYTCLNPVEFDDDAEAYAFYSEAEKEVAALQRLNVSGVIFDGITNTLISIADSSKAGVKIVFVVILVIASCIYFSPFLFLFLLSVCGVASTVRGKYIQNILRKLFSVKNYLNNSYNEDIFQQDRNDIMSSCEDFLESARSEYLNEVSSEVYSFNEELLNKIDEEFSLEKQKLDSKKDLLNQELINKQEQLEAIIKRIEEIEEEAKRYAEIARKKFLGEVTWKKEWLHNIFIEVSADNKVRVIPYAQGNSLYYSDSLDCLKTFSRLLVFQNMISMHPDFASSFVLDYKYNGGELTQFLTAPECSVKICYTEEDLNKQFDFIGNDIRSRTNNVLSSCSSLEEFNALMATYNTSGERYIIVHLFGLDSLNDSLKNFLRNGNRVGYYFKLYLTKEELKSIGEDLSLECFNEFYEINDTPKPRLPSVIRKLLESR